MNFLNSLYNNLLLMRVDILVFHSEMDTARPWQYSFSDPAIFIMNNLNHQICFIIIMTPSSLFL